MRGKYVYHSDLSEHFQGGFPLFVNRWEEGFDLSEHDHAYVEIAYVMAGEGYHYVGDRVEKAHKGCLYVLPVGTSHVFRPSGASKKSRLLVYNVCIKTDFVRELRSWLSRYAQHGEAAFSVLDGEPGASLALVDRTMELASFFERMHREFTERQPGFEASVFGSLLSLVVRLSRLSRSMDAPERFGAARTPQPNVSAILDYVQLHFAERLTVESLASSFGVSARHFLRLFRQATGMGFSEYMQRRRIEYACRLLTETDLKVAAIAKAAGYRDAAHFTEIFRRHAGTSPSRYRRSE
ncbi:helix-turn-helix domain-containing protein [Paenibacillus antri]|uniref:Helix-turn-helix domain-containing protein n=1 Tax=Paenibacillus antri TaxID=2582848 RepID=A0A5R9G3Q8_9BACL|nr:AraC family transcriptional regulator [Paenibacillus antri]TLS48770.1 helix-turn-helix domain-containing protein [Paenibacillus antri]